jgi:hypothetical protein
VRRELTNYKEICAINPDNKRNFKLCYVYVMAGAWRLFAHARPHRLG